MSRFLLLLTCELIIFTHFLFQKIRITVMWPHMNHLLWRWCRNSRLLLGLIMAAEHSCVTLTNFYKKV